LDHSVVEYNARKLSSAVLGFFKAALSYAGTRLRPSEKWYGDPVVLDNFEWYQDLTLLDFLNLAGYHTRVNTMISRDRYANVISVWPGFHISLVAYSVKARLDSQTGISFTEFTYQLLQAYDFHELKKNEDCSVQIGGSDQWGNILAGVDLINRTTAASDNTEARAFGITTPLLTTSGGQKFSKTGRNTVWLDMSMTSYLDFYQVNKYMCLSFYLEQTDMYSQVFHESFGRSSWKLAQVFHSYPRRRYRQINGASYGILRVFSPFCFSN
jgi:tyrosyl-tRNA synthetase